MKLNRWQPWAEQTLNDAKSAAVTGVESLDGDPRCSRITLANGAAIHVQWVRTAPPTGDGGDEEKIITGEAPAPVDVPDVPVTGKVPTAELERHLAALLANGGNPELISVIGYSQDPKLGSDRQPFGVRVLCHSGAVIFGLFRHTLGAGQTPTQESTFKQRETL
ncbi:hypothetical protein [Actinomadura rubrisoli]|uniref:Uncharacterized protein n=1 Tax=Actinomadura rubrisoli TaxID=2530368 RepID=A0A4R5AC43_9ACTN|nr:hypothetical protein [Actinomadura rubrisoli]TDD69791.1 hypothetical protein E1298_37205 [Actinomadura rubrisoli]